MASASTTVPSGIVLGPGITILTPTTIRAVRAGGQPSSNPVADAVLAPIPDGGPLDFTPIPVSFAQDLNDTLGDYGTDQDGWETLLSDMELSIADDAAGVDDAITILDDITDIDFDAFSAANLDPIGTDLAAFNTKGDTLLGQFNTDFTPITVDPPPPPPQGPPPPPPILPGGGGGGTGGDDGGGGWIWVWEPNADGETGQWVLEYLPPMGPSGGQLQPL